MKFTIITLHDCKYRTQISPTQYVALREALQYHVAQWLVRRPKTRKISLRGFFLSFVYIGLQGLSYQTMESKSLNTQIFGITIFLRNKILTPGF